MVGDDEFLAVIRNSPDPFLSTAEIADELPIGRNGTLKRLQELEKQGMVKSKRVGHSLAWWLPEPQS